MQSKQAINESNLPTEHRRALYKLNAKLTSEIELLLTELGVDLSDYVITEEHIRGPAPCHGGNNPIGWIFYFRNGNWKCWTHHCEEEYGKSCVGLIRAILDCSYTDAWKKAVEFVDTHSISDERVEELRQKQNRAFKEAKENAWKEHRNPIKVFPESCLDHLIHADEFAKNRELDPKLFRQYRIGLATKGKMTGRIIIPIRNLDGQIVGFSGRKVKCGSNDLKWLHWPGKDDEAKLKTGIHFFNLDNAFKYNVTNDKNDYILTEGPFDTLKMEMAGVHNSISTFGNGVSEGQIEVLRQLGATKVWIAYDGDEAGKDGAQRTMKKLEKNLFSVCIIELERAYPDWNQTLYGGLDWGNAAILPKYVKQIVDSYVQN